MNASDGKRTRSGRVAGGAKGARLVSLALLIVVGAGAVAATSFRWPTSSRFRVAPLAQPTLESRIAAQRPGPEAGFSFAAFGDQRALAGGEWESMVASIDSLSKKDPRLLFMLDTGDNVNNGSYSDQFRELTAILSQAPSLAYLVGVGNHELDENRSGAARRNTAAYLAPIDPSISPDRLFYERTIGRVRFLFLDTNDFAYDRGRESRARLEAQLAWLTEALRPSSDRPGYPTVAVMHHPILQSSSKHRAQSRDLWSFRYHGRTLPDILADGGVDMILTGHTHTYERFRAARKDGKGFQIVNLSGRPRASFLWFGEDARRAEEIPAGGEQFWFYDRGWRDLDGWEISQDDAMVRDEADEYAIFQVEPDGGVTMAVRFMNKPSLDPPVRLLWGESRP